MRYGEEGSKSTTNTHETGLIVMRSFLCNAVLPASSSFPHLLSAASVCHPLHAEHAVAIFAGDHDPVHARSVSRFLLLT